MAYTPLKIGFKNNSQRATSLMAKKGVNKRDLPQLLTPEFALNIQNLIITADGGLTKRKGLEKLEDILGGKVEMLEIFTEDLLIYAYDNIVAAYDVITDTSTTIHTYSTSSQIYSGDRYGGYFFVTNGKEEIGRVTQILNYDAQTVNFTVGSILTGTTSGATATILQDADGGAAGVLTLGYIEGVFQDNEAITDIDGGAAVANGAVTWGFATMAGSPICKVLTAIGTRLYAGNLDSDRTAVWYSQADDGSNPPFGTWTVGTNAADPGKLYFRNAGAVNDIVAFGGDIVVVFSEFGKWAFYTETIESAGSLKKIDRTVMQKVDFGGLASVYTDEGLFYVNKAGLWQLVSLGQNNVPFSDQEFEGSVLLGDSYFRDVDFSNADLVYDPTRKLILITCAKNSEVNNFVIVYSTEFKGFSFFSGWNIENFADINGTIYAGSALSTKLYEVFGSFADEGKDIWIDFYQELRLGGLETRQELQKFYSQGILSADSDVTVAFDIFNKDGNFVKNKTVWQWMAQSGAGSLDGFGVASWGTSSWGGDIDMEGMIENFNGCAPRIANFQRVRVHITEHSQLPLVINWFSVEGRVKTDIRRRKMTKIS